MSSARERFKKANQDFIGLGDSETNKPTIVDDIIHDYNTSVEEKKEIEEKPEKKVPVQPEKKSPDPKSEATKATPKVGGRPKKYDGTLKTLKIYMPEECYNFIKANGWKYDGMNGFINHLIEEEMKKN